MRSVKIAIGVGLATLAIALAAVLSLSPLTVVGSNGIPASKGVGFVGGERHICQVSGTMPAGTSAIRISALTKIGPSIDLQVLSESSILTHGSRGAGWGDAGTFTVPITPLSREVPEARVCVTFGSLRDRVLLEGALAELPTSGGDLKRFGKFRVEYLKPGQRSWWSLVPAIARRMGFGHAPAGTWIVFLLAALIVTAAILAVRLLIRASGPSDARPRARNAALTCALIACLNAACWSLLTPPFQTPDEPSHFAYVQQIAQTGHLPTSHYAEFSPEEEMALHALRQSNVQWHPAVHTIETAMQERSLQKALAAPLARAGPGGAGVASSEPPLYYALQTIPYWLGSSGSLLDRLELMRLLSALMAGITALFVYLFIRETLPRFAWTWAVGGAGVALMPLLGFMSGAVNPDAMLYAVSAALFYLLARGFTRGLTPGLAIAIGVASAITLLTKLNFLGMYPGVLIGVTVLAWRLARQSSRREAVRCMVFAFGISACPLIVYGVLNVISRSPTFGIASTAAGQASRHGSLAEGLSYIWQFYLPRLPGMVNYFTGISSLREIWFDRSVGLYGWLDTYFPAWVENLALIASAILACLVLRALFASRHALRHRLAELTVYAIVGGGLLLLVGLDSYLTFPAEIDAYGHPRYLLPLLAIFGAALALGARGVGRRWGPAAGALLVVLLLAHDIFSQLQTIARFYG